MINKQCTKCNFDNDVNARYCQNCGNKLPEKESLKHFISTLNFDSAAGAGAKGISLAPLACLDLNKTSYTRCKNHYKVVTKHHILEDGSWYCPYCGKKNKQTDFECSDCRNSRP